MHQPVLRGGRNIYHWSWVFSPLAGGTTWRLASFQSSSSLNCAFPPFSPPPLRQTIIIFPQSLFRSVWAPQWTSSEKSALQLPTQGKAICPLPSPEHCCSFKQEEQEGSIDWRQQLYMQEKASPCRTCQTNKQKASLIAMAYACRYARGRSADAHNVTHSKVRASDAEDNPETSTQTHLHDRRVTELCSPVSPHRTRMHGKVWQECNADTYLMPYSSEN